MEQKDRRGRDWHLDKTVSISHIISTILIVISILAWAQGVEKRVEQNAQGVKFISERLDAQDKRIDEMRSELRDDLKQVNNKLDRLIERR
jgi:hypothetical protein